MTATGRLLPVTIEIPSTFDRLLLGETGHSSPIKSDSVCTIGSGPIYIPKLRLIFFDIFFKSTPASGISCVAPVYLLSTFRKVDTASLATCAFALTIPSHFEKPLILDLPVERLLGRCPSAGPQSWGYPAQPPLFILYK